MISRPLCVRAFSDRWNELDQGDRTGTIKFERLLRDNG